MAIIFLHFCYKIICHISLFVYSNTMFSPVAIWQYQTHWLSHGTLRPKVWNFQNYMRWWGISLNHFIILLSYNHHYNWTMSIYHLVNYCESQQSLVDLLTSTVFTYCRLFVRLHGDISIVWCFKPLQTIYFLKAYHLVMTNSSPLGRFVV